MVLLVMWHFHCLLIAGELLQRKWSSLQGGLLQNSDSCWKNSNHVNRDRELLGLVCVNTTGRAFVEYVCAISCMCYHIIYQREMSHDQLLISTSDGASWWRSPWPCPQVLPAWSLQDTRCDWVSQVPAGLACLSEMQHWCCRLLQAIKTAFQRRKVHITENSLNLSLYERTSY